jgi:hypothetical protein
LVVVVLVLVVTFLVLANAVPDIPAAATVVESASATTLERRNQERMKQLQRVWGETQLFHA